MDSGEQYSQGGGKGSVGGAKVMRRARSVGSASSLGIFCGTGLLPGVRLLFSARRHRPAKFSSSSRTVFRRRRHIDPRFVWEFSGGRTSSSAFAPYRKAVEDDRPPINSQARCGPCGCQRRALLLFARLPNMAAMKPPHFIAFLLIALSTTVSYTHLRAHET